jgi:hypothetical protein
LVSFVVRGWNGDERLWKVTWLGYAGGVLLVTGVAITLHEIAAAASNYVLAPVIVILNVWAFVAIWRCAPNADWSGWLYIARGLVATAAIGWLLDILGIVE